ncbi:MAG: cAMP/cGMP-dependent 3',5'-cyclic-AMP/GMP phosphodiesterase, partial [Desulfovibrionales bacterium]|nr:cAMP/cGMP-dependent 3',5'-cyclic-AMP/GMP phosphodiesterase [Desulfovibrionales bacterium]
EFPIYYHYFFHGKKVHIVCAPSQRDRLVRVLQESLFGPEHLDLVDEFPGGRDTPGFPDIRAEMDHFRNRAGHEGRLELADLVAFHPFDKKGNAVFGDIRVHRNRHHTYTFFEGERELARIPLSEPLTPDNSPCFATSKIFHPPLFGVTTLGSGHGFDPDAMTSGMIIWINRRGIMVDPPVNSAVDLVRRGVNPKVLDSIILTHCHADHDAGTLQKILQEGRITLYTTRTIFNGFMNKSSALTRIPRDRLERAVLFIPLKMGAAVNIHGGEFLFHYSLHSIPTIFFEVAYGGKSMVYSSDTHNNPDHIRALYKEGVMDQGRRDFLLNFPWDRDVIFHEAGVPPLHTPMSCLLALPRRIRERIYLVHVARDRVPSDSGLKLAPTGLSATVELEVHPRRFDEATEILGVYLDNPLFRGLPPEKTMEFLSIVQPRHFMAGAPLLREGKPHSLFYMIMSGQVDILGGGQWLTTYGRSDFFGEGCLFSSAASRVEAVARSEVKVITIDKEKMRAFIRGASMEDTLFQLSALHHPDLRGMMDANPVFAHLTPSQKIQLFQIVKPVEVGRTHRTLMRQDSPVRRCYYLHHGRVRVNKNGGLVTRLGPGALFGIRALLGRRRKFSHTFVAEPGSLLYAIPAEDLEIFLENNPGVLLRVYHTPH